MTSEAVPPLVTGGHGFLGWHLSCHLRALYDTTPRRLGRAEFGDPALLAAEVGRAEVVYHLAGVNRGDSDAVVERSNIALAEDLAEAVGNAAKPLTLVYANSVQSILDNPYGRGKAEAARLLADAVTAVGGKFVDVRLPNLFGEHGRPAYNSFVATFASAVARGEQPVITTDREVPLLHAQDAAAFLVSAGAGPAGTFSPTGRPLLVSEVAEKLAGIHAAYIGGCGELPDLSDPFDLALFNTYRSYLFPDAFPLRPPVHADSRGQLWETVRLQGGGGQAFVSTTRPGATRGDHYHLRRVERFAVVQGEAEIRLRKVLADEVVVFRLGGDAPGFVDMPTMWVHNITNVGDRDLITVFWSNQLFDPGVPDQFPEMVEVGP